MLNKMKIAMGGALIAAAMVSATANAATESANATVEILTPVELTVDNSLDFGLVAAGASAGTVTLPVSSDTRSCSSVICVGTANRGAFHVSSAADGQVIALSVDRTASLTGPGTAMPVSLSLSTSSITYADSASETVYVGGELSIGASQTAGVYTGTFNISADYQ